MNQAWKQASKADTVVAYESFKQAYPGQAARADQSIKALQANEAWGRIGADATIADYEAFINAYGRYSRHTVEARKRLKSLMAERDWRVACEADTVEAYRTFLRKNRNSAFNGEAHARIKAGMVSECTDLNELADALCGDEPEALRAAARSRVEELLADPSACAGPKQLEGLLKISGNAQLAGSGLSEAAKAAALTNLAEAWERTSAEECRAFFAWSDSHSLREFAQGLARSQGVSLVPGTTAEITYQDNGRYMCSVSRDVPVQGRFDAKSGQFELFEPVEGRPGGQARINFASSDVQYSWCDYGSAITRERIKRNGGQAHAPGVVEIVQIDSDYFILAD